MASIRLPPLPRMRDIVKLYRLSAIKQLSQNFLMDEQLTDKIVKHAGKIYDSSVLEVGPGPGAITRSIMRKSPKHLVVVEKDERFRPTLDMFNEAFSTNGRKFNAIFNDIMSVNMETMFEENEKRYWNEDCPDIFVIGNLPFSVSTPLIIKWLRQISERQGLWSYGRVRMTLTFQKEVAERLVAKESDSQRCRLSVMAQAWTKPKLQFIIPGSAFVPKPEVDVGVVSFTPLKEPRTTHDFEIFEKITRHIFSFRQKHTIKCTSTLFPPDCQDHLSMVMHKLADVDPEARPFELSVEDINRLTSSYKYLCEKYPEIIHYSHRASRKVISKRYTKGITIKLLSQESNS